MGKLQNKVRLIWSSNFAYAIGLIASDGCLNSDQRHIWFSSAEEEMMLNYKKALELSNNIGRYARGGEKEKRYYCLTFGDKNFYQFLNRIGITSAKSKTIKSVCIPDEYFSDFLRGLFDGDGTFYTFQDKRWPNSHGYQISFASASRDFVTWLQGRLSNLYSVKGFLHRGVGVWDIRYVKGDSIKLYLAMYNKNGAQRILFLRRKYDKITRVFSEDNLFKKLTTNAVVAQW